jgi:hypothetical protein
MTISYLRAVPWSNIEFPFLPTNEEDDVSSHINEEDDVSSYTGWL